MVTEKTPRGRRVLRLLFALGLLALSGCGGLKLVPVSGTVMLGEEPLKLGRICYYPDRSKGNENSLACISRVNGEGHYEIMTVDVRGNTNKGVPLGWYKVAFMNSNEMKTDLDDLVKQGKLNRKYADDKKSPLAVEVVESPEPGRYDFKVTK
jgi:hypothetical protein